MSRVKTVFSISVLLALALPAAAKQDKAPKPGAVVKSAVKEINQALAKKDAAALKVAYARAVSLRETVPEKKLAPVVQAVGKGVRHKDVSLAVASVETLGTLKVVGSSKQLNGLLKPGPKVAGERLNLHVAAIRATGEIHDPASVKPLEKLLAHKLAPVATAAAEALGRFKTMDAKPRLALIKRLVKVLAKLEKPAPKATDETKAWAAQVQGALVAALRELTGQELSKASEWNGWIKEQGKKKKV